MRLNLFITFIVVSLYSFTQTTAIPDPNFEQALINLNLDVQPIDGVIHNDSVSDIEYLNIEYNEITNLAGIEAFSSLKTLKAGNNEISSFDVSDNSQLRILECHNNQISSIDVSQNTLLEELITGNNPINEIDVSFCPNLKELWCWSNNLDSLDVTNNPELLILLCSYNNITYLDVTNNVNLVELLCVYNNIEALELSNCLDLNWLWCNNNNLTSLDLTQNEILVKLNCQFNQLSELNLENNPELVNLKCNDNQIGSINLSNNPNLEEVWCQNNMLNCMNFYNGNNWKIPNSISFQAQGNPDLICIEVDNASYSSSVWSFLDSQTSFSENCNNHCSTASVNEFSGHPKDPVRIVDPSGREVAVPKKNSIILIIYSDGTVEKKFVKE